VACLRGFEKFVAVVLQERFARHGHLVEHLHTHAVNAALLEQVAGRLEFHFVEAELRAVIIKLLLHLANGSRVAPALALLLRRKS
jgi:hypothetical protein